MDHPDTPSATDLTMDVSELHDRLIDIAVEHPAYEQLFLLVLRRKLQEALLLCERHLKYGPHNIANPPPGIPPELAILVRMTDKLARISNVVRTGTGLNSVDESVGDSWMDGANYSTIGYLVSAGLWPFVRDLPTRLEA